MNTIKMIKKFAAVAIAAVTFALAPSAKAESLMATFDFSENTWNLPTTTCNIEATYIDTDTDQNITMVPAEEEGSTGWKWSKEALVFGKAGTGIQLPAFDFQVTRIVVTGPESGASTGGTYNIFTSDSDDDPVSAEQSGTIGVHEFEVSGGGVGSVYVIRVTNANNIKIAKIEVYGTAAGSATPDEEDTTTEGGEAGGTTGGWGGFGGFGGFGGGTTPEDAAPVVEEPAVSGIAFLAPVYNTSWDFTSGIAGWTTCSFDEYTEVDEYSTVWYEGTYVVSRDVTIDERITCEGVVDLILKDGATLTARAGIEVSGDYNALTIYAQSKGAKMGALVATGNGAAIGGGYGSVWARNITINGGKITAKCTGLYAAGIGGSAGASASGITINGGVVEATGHCGAGIGGGGDGVGENITINGGKVTAIGGGGVGGAAGIGGGDNSHGQGRYIYINGGNVTAIGGGYSGSAIGNGGNASDDAVGIYVSTALIAKADGYNDPMTEIENWGDDLAWDFAGQRYATVAPPTVVLYPEFVWHTTLKVVTESGEIIKASPFKVDAGETVQVVYTADDGYVFADGTTTFVTESFTADADLEWMPVEPPAEPVAVTGGVEFQRPVYRTVLVKQGVSFWETCMTGPFEFVTDQTTWGKAGQKTWYVVEGGVTINSRITCVGDVKLVLVDGAWLEANAGIAVSGEGNALTIYGQWDNKGMLVATSAAASNAGIGGTDCEGGNITINGGIVTARGNTYAAGIGGGGPNPGHDIIINGGTVTAKSANSDTDPNAGWAAGIGGGDGGAGYDIVINGGKVDASCYASGSGIGGGGNSRGSWITINGGIVKAESGSNNNEWNGAGIGGGCNTGADHIYINGGYVEAIGGGGYDEDPSKFGSGIGGGRYAVSSATFVSTDLPLLVDAEFTSPQTPLWNDGDDLSESLKGLRCVTVGTNPEEPFVDPIPDFPDYPEYPEEPEDPVTPVDPVDPEEPVTPEDPVTPVVETELVLWEGEAIVDNWNLTGNQPALLVNGGATLWNANAYAGQEIRFYITPTGEWNADGYENWWCDIVEGNWNSVYVQRCAPGCYNEDDPNREEWYLYDTGYISFTLTQDMLDRAYSKEADQATFMANGDDAIITKITLVNPKEREEEEVHEAVEPDLSIYPVWTDDETVLWAGETVADDWKNQPYFFVNGAADLLDDAGAYEGMWFRIYITPTDTSWGCDVKQGNWNDTYASHCAIGSYWDGAPYRTEFDLNANGGYISFKITSDMLDFANNKESWAGLFLVNADNVVITKIALAKDGGSAGGGDIGGGDIGGGEGGGEGGGTEPEVPVEDPVDPEPQAIQVGENVYLTLKDGVCTLFGTGATFGDKRIGDFVDKNAITSLVIADGVTEIAPRFFKECYKLQSVTGGKDLVSIGERAFYLCLRLETINLACTATPNGLAETVSYRTVIDPNTGTISTIPAVSVANYQRMLRAKKSLTDAEWTDLGSPDGKNLFETGYNFFKVDLVPVTAETDTSKDREMVSVTVPDYL